MTRNIEYITVEEEAWSDRDAVQLTNAKNTMDMKYDKWGSFKESGNNKETGNYI